MNVAVKVEGMTKKEYHKLDPWERKRILEGLIDTNISGNASGPNPDASMTTQSTATTGGDREGGEPVDNREFIIEDTAMGGDKDRVNDAASSTSTGVSVLSERDQNTSGQDIVKRENQKTTTTAKDGGSGNDDESFHEDDEPILVIMDSEESIGSKTNSDGQGIKNKEAVDVAAPPPSSNMTLNDSTGAKSDEGLSLRFNENARGVKEKSDSKGTSPSTSTMKTVSFGKALFEVLCNDSIISVPVRQDSPAFTR